MLFSLSQLHALIEVGTSVQINMLLSGWDRVPPGCGPQELQRFGYISICEPFHQVIDELGSWAHKARCWSIMWDVCKKKRSDLEPLIMEHLCGAMVFTLSVSKCVRLMDIIYYKPKSIKILQKKFILDRSVKKKKWNSTYFFVCFKFT